MMFGLEPRGPLSASREEGSRGLLFIDTWRYETPDCLFLRPPCPDWRPRGARGPISGPALVSCVDGTLSASTSAGLANEGGQMKGGRARQATKPRAKIVGRGVGGMAGGFERGEAAHFPIHAECGRPARDRRACGPLTSDAL